MNLTLEEWLAIDERARAAQEALRTLDRQLNQVLLDHMGDDNVLKFITTMQDRLADGAFIAASLQLQSEWCGGDSSDPRNHALREPNALSIIGHIPHQIRGSRGVKQ